MMEENLKLAWLSVDEALAEWTEGEAEKAEKKKEVFRIRDEKTLEWWIGKLRSYARKKEIVEEMARERLKDIENDMRALVNWFAPQAEKVTRELLDGKRKSVKTLQGKAGFRTLKTGLDIEDKESFIVWARENLPEAHQKKTVESVDKRLVQKHFEKTGEIPGGCKVRHGGERFWIEDVKIEKFR